MWSRRWYSNKFQGPGLCYEVAVSIINGDICWVNGPFAPGIYSDYKLFKECGLLDHLEDGERVEADEAYVGSDPAHTKTPGGSWHPTGGRDVRNAAMARQEAAHSRLKSFRVLKQIFRHNMDKHQNVVLAVTTVVQLSINNGERLFTVSEYNDSVWI